MVLAKMFCHKVLVELALAGPIRLVGSEPLGFKLWLSEQLKWVFKVFRHGSWQPKPGI